MKQVNPSEPSLKSGKSGLASRQRTSQHVWLDAAKWLNRSGIQNHDKYKGAVAAWYDLHRKEYPYLYSEITGYAITTFVFLQRIDHHENWIEYAQMSADWLTEHAFDANGGAKTRYYLKEHDEAHHYSFEGGRLYAFDTAMVAYGLLQLYRYKKDNRLLASIKNALHFLSERLKKSDHSYFPYYDLRTKACGEDTSKWSNQFGGYHAKLALCYVDAYRYLDQKKYQGLAIELLDGVAKYQLDSGRFISNRTDESTHHHPHAYTLEGFLYGGMHLDREDYLDVALQGLNWLLRGVGEDGSVATLFSKGSFSAEERIDIVAQTLRIGSICYGLGLQSDRQLKDKLEALKRHLLKYQYASGDQKGGFLYAPQDPSASLVPLNGHLNAWVTMFAIQSLWMYEEFVIKNEPVNLDHFI